MIARRSARGAVMAEPQSLGHLELSRTPPSIPFVVAALVVALMMTAQGALAADDSVLDGFTSHEYRSAAGVTLPYRLYSPPSAGAGERLPLILYLHGSGGAGTDNRKQISGGNTRGTHLWLEAGIQTRHPAFVLAPQIPDKTTWHSANDQSSMHGAALLQLVDELRSELNIDANRIYVVGQSLGGFGAWDLIARQPARFAAAIPLCGGGDVRRIVAARDVAVWAFHGARDKTVPVSRSREIVAALRTVNPSVKYTEYAEVGHDVWTRAFAERDLPEWLFAQRRRD